MASDPIAIPSLECLRSTFADPIDLTAIYTQPDRRTGRGKKLTPNAIKTWADSRKVPVFQPQKMNSAAIDEFEKLQADLVIVMAYGHILPKRMLTLAGFGFYNLHASLLPKLRGASPIETAIVTGEKTTGVTLMEVVPALDAGPIVDIQVCDIHPSMTAPELRMQMADACVPLLQRALPLILKGCAPSTPQDSASATYCRLIDKDDGYLDFNLGTRDILHHILGFQPWPGALFELEAMTYRIGKASDTPSTADLPSPATPGTLFCDQKKLAIAASDGWIEILEIQKPGGKMLPVAEFLNGSQLKSGSGVSFPNRYPLIKNQYFKKPTLDSKGQ